MIELQDVTFTIPLRYDTDDRIGNFKATLSYLVANLNTNIYVIEEDKTPRFDKLCEEFKCRYDFVKTDDIMFHRTKLLNIMAKNCLTPYIVNYDVDCIVDVDKYQIAVDKLRNNEFDIMTGFDGFTWNVPQFYHKKIAAEGNIKWLTTKNCICANTVDKAMGGIVWWNKEKFIEAGMENENFVSWGAEDQERVHRAKKLGYRYGKVPGELYHLEHRRLTNSWMHHPLIKKNDAEFKKVKDMTSEQLRAYVNTWPWVPRK